MEGRCRGGVMQTRTGTTSVSSIGCVDSATHRQTPEIGLPRGGCRRTALRCPSAPASRNRACGTAGPCSGRWQISRAVLDVHAQGAALPAVHRSRPMSIGHPATVRERAQPYARREPGPAANERAVMLPTGFCQPSDMPHHRLPAPQTSAHGLPAVDLPTILPMPRQPACDDAAAFRIASTRLAFTCDAPSSVPAPRGWSRALHRSPA